MGETMIRRVLIAAALSLSLILASLVGAQPASAGTDGDCGGGELCMYWGTFLNGPIFDTPSSVDTFVGHTFWASTAQLNDNVASVRSRASWFYFRLFEHAYYSGAFLQIETGQTLNQLGVMTNQGSSEYWD